jgi:hypothetical protein
MCGKTVVEDEIKLVVDHKKPRAWGGAYSGEVEQHSGGKSNTIPG